MPAGIENWNSHNEGGSDFFKVNYKQSDESLDILEEADMKSIGFEWSMGSVDFVQVDQSRRELGSQLASTNSRLLAQSSTELVYATSITLKLNFTQPLYVSAFEEKDTFEARLTPKLFSFDEDVEMTDEEVEMIVFRGKLTRQVSDEQLAAIE